MFLGELKRDIVDYRLERRRVPGARGQGWSSIWRYYPRWKRDARRHASPLDDGKPWITYAATAFLEGVLRPEMRVFEFGSGGSTVFFASRVKEVFAAEHDRGWSDRVVQELERRGLSHAHVVVREPEHEPTEEAVDAADPRAYRSSDPEYQEHIFRDYAASIDEFPEEHFDVVMIDGRARPSCLLHAIPRLKAGGYLMLDNAERDLYAGIHEELAARGWKKWDLSGPGAYSRYFWSTCAWRKPE